MIKPQKQSLTLLCTLGSAPARRSVFTKAVSSPIVALMSAVSPN
jgi:hypothetical protein